MAAAMTEPRRPYHLAVAAGLSVAVYAASLAGVTALQAGQNAALAAARAPAAGRVADLRRRNDALQTAVASTAQRYEQAAGAYERLRGQLDRLSTDLATLDGTVGAVVGGAANLPTSVSLPPVASPMSRSTAPPATNATTGASGRP